MNKINVKQNRVLGLAVIGLFYVLALILAIRVFNETEQFDLVFRVLFADISATVFIYMAGLLLGNASVYDPYWSVAPIVILTLLAIHLKTFSTGAIILLLLIWYWGIRLTANWVLTFHNLGSQDWRYDMLREKSERYYPLVNLTGIHLFPTLVVFLAIIPAIHYIQSGVINAITLCGYAICLIATTLQWIADCQMHEHRQKQTYDGWVIDQGLWQYCRHPNYLGEILMWWGVYLVMVSAIPARWYLLAGALVNTLMFLFISIPMAEERLMKRKNGFPAYCKKTPKIIPLRKKSAQ